MSNTRAYDTFYKGLQDFLPPKSLHSIATYLAENEVFLKITPKRSTKLGDYRPPFGQKGHRISINGDLNPYAFLNTLVHELAHLLTYKQFAQTVTSHGIEWKQNYQMLMNAFLGKGIFPIDLEKQINKYIKNPHSSTCSDPNLLLAFRKYDEKKMSENTVWVAKLVEELEAGEKFVLNDKIFIKETKLRKWYKCTEIATNKAFRFHPSAEVLVSQNNLLDEWANKLQKEALTLAQKQGFDKNVPKTAVKNLPKGAFFKINDERIFEKGRKLRTRYECKETLTGMSYTVGQNLLVQAFSKNDN